MAPTQAGTHQILANSIAAVDQAQMAANTIKGNNTGGASNELDLSIAQVVAMLSTPTGSGANTRIAYWSGTNTLTSDADFTFDGSQLALAVQGNTGGILIGGDALLYRSAADILRTPDSLTVDGALVVSGAFSTSDTTPIFGSFTLTVADSGTVALGVGSAGQLALWDGANLLIGDVGLTYDGVTFTFTGAAASGLAAETFDVSLALARTVTFTHLSVPATQRAMYITAPTYATSTSTDTMTTAATLAISGPPVAGTGMTITNRYSIFVESGVSRFAGATSLGSTLSVNGLVTLVNSVDIATTRYIGIGSGAGRIVFTDAATDTIEVETATFSAKLGLNIGSATGAATGELAQSAATQIWNGFTLTAAATGTLPVGTGASTRLAYWSGTNTLTGSGSLTYNGTNLTLQGGDLKLDDGERVSWSGTGIVFGSGPDVFVSFDLEVDVDLRVVNGGINIGSATGATVGQLRQSAATQIWNSLTLTAAATGTLPVGTGTNGRVAIWSGTNTLSDDSDLTFSGSTLTVTTLVVGTGGITSGNDISASAGNIGGSRVMLVSNTDNTNAASHARLAAQVGGSSAGDPLLLLTIASVDSWYMGADNSDSDTLKIGTGTAVGTNARVSVTTAGIVTLVESVNMASTKYIGLGSGAGRIVFTDATTDAVTIATANLGLQGNTTPDKILSSASNYFGIASDASSNFSIVSNAYWNGSLWKTSTTGYASDASQIEMVGDAIYLKLYAGAAADETITWVSTISVTPSLVDIAGTIRSTTQAAPSSGTGVELYYYIAGDYAELLSYNRTGSARKPIRITASSILLDGTSNYIAATSWTPTWTGTGTNPAIGNGTQAHFYVRYGDVCYLWGNITMGTTTTYGTGGWEFTVPIAAINNPRFQIGSAQLLDSGVADYIGQVRHDASTGKFRIITQAGGTVGQLVPHTWANTDVLAYSLVYRVA